MYRVKIFTIGKTKEIWLSDAIDEYTKRLKPILHLDWVITKHLSHLLQLLEKEPHYLCLDANGTAFSSEEFAKEIEKQFLLGGSRLSFAIGGAEGLPIAVKSRASFSISLSSLTFTHQLARLVFLEQLYRAMEIGKGSAYHK